jgi:hypothetical protein
LPEEVVIEDEEEEEEEDEEDKEGEDEAEREGLEDASDELEDDDSNGSDICIAVLSCFKFQSIGEQATRKAKTESRA